MSYLSPKFKIRHIRIGTIEEASCLNMGNNFPIGFESFKKLNQGFGSITGDHNDIEDICSKLKDTKAIDMVNQAGDEEIPEWVEKLIKKKMS